MIRLPEKKAATDRLPASDEFPPAIISLRHFIRGGSDREFRDLLYSLIGLSTLMLQNRQRFAAFIGLTDPQYTMLTMIAENPGITVGKLAQRLHVSSQFVTIEIGRLNDKAIVTKRPNEQDRR